ncbi:hypothetical protein GCM10027161_49020 [Microbispora hainanensis]
MAGEAPAQAPGPAQGFADSTQSFAGLSFAGPRLERRGAGRRARLDFAARGLIHDEGTTTTAGRALRDQAERMTGEPASQVPVLAKPAPLPEPGGCVLTRSRRCPWGWSPHHLLALCPHMMQS